MNTIESILNTMDIKLNGHNPSDIQIHDERFITELIKNQSLGAGESYVNGWWDCNDLEELFFRITRNNADLKFKSNLKEMYLNALNFFVNHQSRERASKVSEVHYNLGNKLYELMLGKSMAYTCSYWIDAKSLDEAQFAKYDLVCRKLYLNPKDKKFENNIHC